MTKSKVKNYIQGALLASAIAPAGCGDDKPAASTETGTVTSTATTATADTATDATTNVTSTTGVGEGPQDCELDGCTLCVDIDAEGPPPTPYCRNLLHVCDLPEPCAALDFLFTDGAWEVDVDAGICVLETMKAGLPAQVQISDFDLSGELLLPGGGAAMIQWDFGFGDYVGLTRSGVLTLQPASYFDDCLVEPTPDSLHTCILGSGGQCPAPDWTPPFADGTCAPGTAAGCTLGL